ncbi:MAG: acylphosphatase [Planctomycetaceae bacterium]
MPKSQKTAPVGVEVHYSGRVQGVGFRVNARQIARRFQVTGFVKNLEDGRVQLRAEGEEGEVKAFLGAVVDSMERNISGTTVSDVPASGRFLSFEITN